MVKNERVSAFRDAGSLNVWPKDRFLSGRRAGIERWARGKRGYAQERRLALLHRRFAGGFPSGLLSACADAAGNRSGMLPLRREARGAPPCAAQERKTVCKQKTPPHVAKTTDGRLFARCIWGAAEAGRAGYTVCRFERRRKKTRGHGRREPQAAKQRR